MLIRFLLVSIVAGLGFEPPSACDVSDWSRSGRDWVLARIDDFKGARLVAERDRADAEFDATVTGMANDFTADLAALDRPKVKAQITFEPIAVPDGLDLDVAACMNRDSQGEGQVVSIVEAAKVPEITSSADDEPGRATRLASAVRLTRQAALAWMTVLHETGATVVRR